MISSPPTSLTPNTRYEELSKLCNGKGYFCNDIPQLQQAVVDAFKVILVFFHLINGLYIYKKIPY